MKLQTSHHISAKSVNICDSYSKFSKITKKHISVHYRHRHDWLPSVRPCEWQDVSTPKVCVQNVHRVLERKLEDADSTAWPLRRWPPAGNIPTLRSGATSAGRRHESGCSTYAPAASHKSGSRLRVGIVGGGWGFNPQFMSTDAHFWVKIGFIFQSLGKISNISAADPPVLLGQFQHWVEWVKVRTVGWPQSWSDEVWCFMS